MANHMNEVANMLGVELGEEFEINMREGTYILCGGGLYHSQAGCLCYRTLTELLAGEVTIKRKPWKPSYNERYYSIGPGGVLEPGTWMNDFVDRALYKLGNCYRTAQAAEADRNKWINFYESNDVLEY